MTQQSTESFKLLHRRGETYKMFITFPSVGGIIMNILFYGCMHLLYVNSTKKIKVFETVTVKLQNEFSYFVEQFQRR